VHGELREQQYVDEVMRGVSGTSEKTQVERFHALSVRMGVVRLSNSAASPYVIQERTI